MEWDKEVEKKSGGQKERTRGEMKMKREKESDEEEKKTIYVGAWNTWFLHLRTYKVGLCIWENYTTFLFLLLKI